MFINANIITNKLNVKLEQSNAPLSNNSSNHSNISFEAQVHTEKQKILVSHEKCYLIKEFSLSPNFSYDCYWKYLPIEFLLNKHSGEKAILNAYLDKDNELIHEQEITNVCQKIRRLFFNF